MRKKINSHRINIGKHLIIYKPSCSSGFKITLFTKRFGCLAIRPWQITKKEVKRFYFYISPCANEAYCTFALGKGLHPCVLYGAKIRRKEFGLHPEIWKTDVEKLMRVVNLKILREYNAMLKER